MAIGKYQPIVYNDTIYAMNTETGDLYHLNMEDTEEAYVEDDTPYEKGGYAESFRTKTYGWTKVGSTNGFKYDLPK